MESNEYVTFTPSLLVGETISSTSLATMVLHNKNSLLYMPRNSSKSMAVGEKNTIAEILNMSQHLFTRYYK